MNIFRIKCFVTCVTLAIILGACSTMAASNGDPLEDTNWELFAYRKSKPIAGSVITASFEEGRISGSAGCNTYFGSYEIDGNNIKISELAMTEMACLEPEGIMDQELTYLQYLADAKSYQIEDDKLLIYWTDHDAFSYIPAEADLE